MPLRIVVRLLFLIIIALPVAVTPTAADVARLSEFARPAPPAPIARDEPGPTEATGFSYVERDSAHAACARDPAGLPPPPEGPPGSRGNYLHTCGNRVYDAVGRPFIFYGLAWWGIEGVDYAPKGLSHRNWREMLDLMASLGYNTIRVPFSSEALEPGQQLGSIVDYDLNPDLHGLTPLEMIDRIVAGARERGLRVVLDRHRPRATSQTPLWYTWDVPEERWIADWRMLAERYLGDDTVVAVDLHNEPYDSATWGDGDPSTDWPLAVERAADAIHEVNPYLLVFVEGVEFYGDDRYWWGGQLMGVRDRPVRLRVPNRVVYTPHDYGPSVWEQGWFEDGRYPDNLPEVWDRHWGYIHDEGIGPVVIGEFGARALAPGDRNALWLAKLMEYVSERDIGYIYWALNPSDDTGSVLREDWQLDLEKHAALAAGVPPRPDEGAAPLSATVGTPSLYRVIATPIVTADSTERLAFEIQIVNHSLRSLDLARCELRYWLSAGEIGGGREQLIRVADGSHPARSVSATLIAEPRGDQTHYLRLRFPPDAGAVASFSASPTWRVEILRSDLSIYQQLNDFSFAAPRQATERPGEWDRVALYVDGRRVWGIEP